MKDIEDIKGDIDRITFPKKYGIKNAKILSSIFVIITISISYLPYYLKILSIYYLIAVIFDDFIFLSTMVLMNINISKGERISKFAMIFGMLSFLLGGVS